MKGYEGLYEVSSLGRVRSQARPRTRGGLLKPFKNKKQGYPTVGLCKFGVKQVVRVHVLVAETFLGPRPPGSEVRHLDGNPGNPAASNLAYGTRSQNLLDMRAHGTHHNGKKTHCPQGHPYDEVNTYWWQDRRHCRTCHARRTSRRAG